MSSISSVSEAISNVVRCISDSVSANVAVVATHDLIRSIATRFLLNFDGIVRLVLITETAVGTSTVSRIDGTSIRVRAQISWHLEFVVPTIYILSWLTVTRRIITINLCTT